MRFASALVLLSLLAASIVTGAAARLLPYKELKRRARSRDKQAYNLHKLAAYGTSRDLMLWLIASLSSAALFVMAAEASIWLVVVLALGLMWLIWHGYHPAVGGMGWKVAALLAPAASSLASFLQPALAPLASWLDRRRAYSQSSGIYEKEDLLELLNYQAYHMENRISKMELKMATGALTFGDKTVGSVMTPKRVVKMVAATDAIGPLLMDELHASGFSRFPVVKEDSKTANPDIVGILYLHDLVGYTEKGRVRDVMKKKVYFINEAQYLKDALRAFIKTEHHLLVVVNNFEEIVGVITIEDVMEQIQGEKIVDEFDRYDDMRAVAGLEAKADEVQHSPPEVVE